MLHGINGRTYDIPVDTDGTVPADVIRRVGGIGSDRALIVKRGDGSNEFINPGENVHVRPHDHFADAALHKRGA